MKRYIQGEGRSQMTLLPESLDEYISDDNPVRVVDAFVEALDLTSLGFEVTPAQTGRPSYHPAVLLKIYIYGYLNRIQSSRRLEREAQRNVELMWLTERLMPDFKTIARFRQEHGKAIQKVCRQFIVLCRQMHLFTEAIVAIDGSKFKAVNSRDRNFTPAKLQRRMQEIESNIARYLTELDTADRQEPTVAKLRSERLQQKMATLKEQMQALQAIEAQLKQAGDGQLSQTDSDSRSMKTRGQGIVGYNVQAAVETRHHLIVGHEVTNEGSDRSQLSNMARKACDAMGMSSVTALADAGYYNGKGIGKCDAAGIAAILPKASTSNAAAEGRFGKDDFIYDPFRDVYLCPAGQPLTYRHASVENGMTIHTYYTTQCGTCPMKAKCTTGKERRVRRWEDEAVLERVQARLDRFPNAMTMRRSTVEHVFGTLKFWMGSTHFLTKGIEQVRTEMSLQVLAYNLKRVMNVVGTKALLQAIHVLA